MQSSNISKKQTETLKKQINTLMKIIPKENINNFKNNLNKLKIINKNKIYSAIYINAFNTTGEYYMLDNKILLYNKDQDTLSHELLHLSSCKTINENIYCGFKVIEGKKVYYRGLNEGFTELLNQKIFGATPGSYEECVKICNILNDIVYDQQDIFNAYFLNNVDYIFDTFLQYGSESELWFTIDTLDALARSESVPNKDLITIYKTLNTILQKKLTHIKIKNR